MDWYLLTLLTLDRKYEARYTKPYKYNVKDCFKEFANVNDLNRHRSVVHRIGMLKAWKCFIPNYKYSDIEWPRLDKLRQHINQMHEGENIDDMVNRWVITKVCEHV